VDFTLILLCTIHNSIYSSKLKLIGFITVPEIREEDPNLTPRTRGKISTRGSREVALILICSQKVCSSL
jgi:hypothetical protein